MINKRKQILITVCAVILSFSAVGSLFYFKENKKKNHLLETDSDLSVQQTNASIPEEEQNNITDEEDYQTKFVEQSTENQIEGTNTYKINEDKCSISYDSGENFIDLPVDVNTLCSNEGGYPYKNKLQNGSYVINSKLSAITYGGTGEIPLSIIISSDSGKTWRTTIVDKEHELKCIRVKIISFVNENCGYLIATNDKSMSFESKIIYKTNDGGNSWSKVNIKTDITGNLLYNAGFISEKLGFLTMISRDEPIIYRTEDGGTSWEEVKVELKDDMYIQPSIPYVSDNKLYLEMGVHQPDEYLNKFEESTVYESKNTGKTFY